MLSFIWAFIIILILCLMAWGYFLRTDNPGVIDAVWSIGILAGGLSHFIHVTPELNAALCVSLLLFSLWAIRLCAWLWYTRIRIGHFDKRYEQLASRWKYDRRLAFLANFLFQGVLMFIISTPLYFMAHATQTHPFNLWVLNTFILLSITGEALADLQLYHYKKNQEGLCQIGLWRLSRHPNLFFDLCTWIGLSAIAFMQPFGAIALISPIALYFIMTKITIPITENSSRESRGFAYEEYAHHTPMLIPRLLPWK